MQTRTSRPSVACGPPVTDPVPSCWICGADAAPDTRYAGLPLVRCGACGFVFAPVRSAEELHRLYTTDYFDAYPGGQAYDADEVQRRHEATVRMQWLRSHATGGRLLEIGSASGWFLAQARDAGFEVEGIEPAADVAFAATARWNVPVQAATAETASLPDGELDVVVAWHALEHIAAPAGVLERLHAALRPGGLLMIEVPNVESAASRSQGAAWFHLDLAHHVGHYAPSTLADLLQRTRVHPDAGRHVPDRRLPAPRPRPQPPRDRVAGQAGGAAPRLAARPAPDAARDAARRSASVTERFLADGASTARQSAVVAASFLLGTALGGLLGLVIGIVLGESAATDSLLAAYSLYLVFALFGGNVRVALVPLIGVGGTDAELRGRAADAVGRLSAVAVVLAGTLVVLSPALGEALNTGDLKTAITSLAILAVASGLQVAAASQAAALAAALRFVASAGLYVISSAAALVLATGFMLAFGAVGAAIGVLGGSAVLYLGHVAYLRRLGVHAGVAVGSSATVARGGWPGRPRAGRRCRSRRRRC